MQYLKYGKFCTSVFCAANKWWTESTIKTLGKGVKFVQQSSTIKNVDTIMKFYWRPAGVFIANLEHISPIFLLFLVFYCFFCFFETNCYTNICYFPLFVLLLLASIVCFFFFLRRIVILIFVTSLFVLLLLVLLQYSY